MSASTASPVQSTFYQGSDNEFTLTDHGNDTQVTLNLERRGPFVQGANEQDPSMEYQGAEGTFSFSGPQIVTTTTTLGSMFSVTLNVVPDLRSLSFTLFVPTVVHGTGEPAQAFDTIAIKSQHHMSLQGTPTTAGADTTYSILKMHGIARKLAVPA